MVYEFVCHCCRHKTEVERSVDNRNDILLCEWCGTKMQRVVSIPSLITDRIVDRPENKYAFGFSDKDRLETLKQGDKEYEVQQSRNEYRLKYEEVYKPSSTEKPLAEIAKEHGYFDAR